MTVSVAHEIVHFLTGFLTGTEEPHAPPEVTAAPYDDQRNNKGEWGRYWESILLSGFLEFWSSSSDPLGVRQAGVPYLFSVGSMATATGQQVSMSYVQQFLNGEFMFPIRVSTRAPPVTRNALKRKGSQETTNLRGSRPFRNTGPVSSPPPGQASGLRFRRINFRS